MKAKIPKSYGPLAYGVEHRGCQDCSGCGAVKWLCNDSNLLLEFIGIEYAMDVEYPTAKFQTTQESIVEGYLKQRYNNNSFVYFNTGIHDASFKRTFLEKRKNYARNLCGYFNVLLKVFKAEQVAWLTTTGVRRLKQPKNWRKIITNDLIEEFNDISIDLASKHGVYVFDLFELSRSSLFYGLNTDGVHYGSHLQPFYIEVARKIFTHFMHVHPNLRSKNEALPWKQAIMSGKI